MVRATKIKRSSARALGKIRSQCGGDVRGEEQPFAITVFVFLGLFTKEPKLAGVKKVRKTDRNLVVPIFFALRLPHLKIGFSNFPDFSRVAAATSRLIFSIFFLSCGSRNSRKMRVARVLRQCRNWVLCASCNCRNSENNGKFSLGLVVRNLVARGFVKISQGLVGLDMWS